MKTLKGKFRPKNPQKYRGNPNEIIYRSSWELRFMRWCDNHPDVLKWSSEELAIPYFSPVDRKYHRYFPDFIIEKKTASGATQTVIIEIKPASQTRPPAAPKKRTKRYLNDVLRYEINKAKWNAAIAFCNKSNTTFQILTENELGIK